MNKKLIRKMLTAAGGPINWLRKRIYTNIEPFGYNDIGSRLYNGIILNKNEHSNFKGNYSDIERAPALYLTIDNIWGEYLHIPEKERRYSNGKYKIKNNGNGTFSLPFKSMEDIMLTVNSNNPLLWGLRGKAVNSVVGEYDIYRGYDKKGDYLKYIDHWRINPYDVKEDKEYNLDNNSLLKLYFKGKDDASFGLGTPVEIQGKYYLDDIYNVKGKDRGGHYLPEIVITGNKKKKQGGKMNILEFLKNGSGIYIKEKNKGKFTSYCGGKVTDKCILKGKNSSNPAIRKRATFAANARKWKHKEGGKAFVSGVSILDSNPDAYKYVKKKLKKHLTGGKTSTWLKIENFLNSDAGKGVIGLGTQLFGTISGTKKAADFSSDYDEATKANVKAMTELLRAKNKKEAGILAAQFISYLLLQNPDNHYGELDLLQITLKIADNLYDPQEIIDYLNLRNAEKLKYMLAIQGSAGGSMSWLDSLGGIASNVLNSNSNTTSSVVLPKLTTNKYTSSTSLSNPVLGNNILGYMPDWSSLLGSSKK